MMPPITVTAGIFRQGRRIGLIDADLVQNGEQVARSRALFAKSWGSAGIEFINADITLAITRLPVDLDLGLSALDRTVNDGIAVGTAAMFDRHGQLGTATVVTLANSANRVHIGRSGAAAPLPD